MHPVILRQLAADRIKTDAAPRGAGLYPSHSEERLEVNLWI